MRILGEIQLLRKWKCWSSNQDLANKWGECPHSPYQKDHEELQWAQLGRTSPAHPPDLATVLQKRLAAPVSVSETQNLQQLQPEVLGDAVGGSSPMSVLICCSSVLWAEQLEIVTIWTWGWNLGHLCWEKPVQCSCLSGRVCLDRF